MRREQRRAAQRQYAPGNPEVAAFAEKFGELNRKMWWAKPGVQLALGKDMARKQRQQIAQVLGTDKLPKDWVTRLSDLAVDPSLPDTTRRQFQQVVGPIVFASSDDQDAVLKAVSDKEAERKSDSGIGWHTVGDIVTRANPVAGIVRAAGAVAAGDFGEAGGALAYGVAGAPTAGMLPVARDLGTGAGELPGVGPGLKGAARAGFTALEAPYQELQARGSMALQGALGAGGFIEGAQEGGPGPGGAIAAGGRGAAAAQRQLGIEPGSFDVTQSYSTGGIALGQALRGEEVDLGEGFLPGGEVREEQARRVRTGVGTIDDEAITPGRLLAYTVVEPGTTPYNIMSGVVDAALILGADPANLALTKVGKVAAARRTFQATDATLETAGAFKGLRNWLHGPTAETTLNSPAGNRVVDWMTDTKSFAEIWRRTGKGKIPAELVRKLANTSTRDETIGLLKPAIGVDIRDTAALKPWSTSTLIRQDLARVRLFNQTPHASANPNNLDEMVDELDRGLANAKTPIPERDRIINQWVDSSSLNVVNGPGRFETMTHEYAKTLEEQMKAFGSPKFYARKLSRLWKKNADQEHHYWSDDIGNDRWVRSTIVNGQEVPVPHPHLPEEFLNARVPLGNAREIRRETSWLRPLMSDKGVPVAKDIARGITLGTDKFMEKLWKPAVLLRGAWTLRVVGEEQIRLAANGGISLANHPLSAMAFIIADDGKMARAIRGITRQQGRIGGRGDLDMLGQVLSESEEFGGALARGSMGFRNSQGKLAPQVRRLTPDDDDDYLDAWAGILGFLRGSGVGRRVAQGGVGPGDKVPVGARQGLDGIKDWFAEGAGRKFRNTISADPDSPIDVSTRAGADEYIDSVVERVTDAARNDPRLQELMTTGKLNGVALTDKRITRELGRLRDEGVGPPVVFGQQFTEEGRNGVVEFMFQALGSTPTNKLSRSPGFRQFYWQRVEELTPRLTRETQTQMLDSARKAGIRGKQLKRLEEATNLGAGEIGGAHADELAKRFALDSTKNLLYDLSERSQFFDVFRNIFPFGEAWREILTRWGRLLVERPQNLRKMQVGVEGARGAGFFYIDKLSQEEVFAYPWTAWMTEKVAGVPAEFVGTAVGLNMATSVLPGVGPIIQFPAGYLIPDRPGYEKLRELVIPFGGGDVSGGVAGQIADVAVPAWAEKWLTGLGVSTPENERLFNNTVMDIMAYKATTGEYKLHGKNADAERKRMEADSREAAQKLYLIRGGLQFVAPSAPQPRFFGKGKNGKLIEATVLRDKFYEMAGDEKAGGYDTAPQRFMEEFGRNAFMFMQPKSLPIIYGVPTSKEGLDWVQEHGDIVKDYPYSYGFFAPEGDGDDFSFDAYNRQIRRGEREPLTPEQWSLLANHRLGEMAYDAKREKIKGSPNDDQRVWLAEWRDEIRNNYPGWRDRTSIPESVNIEEQVIPQLLVAADDPRLKKTDTARGIREFAKYRKKAYEAARAEGLTTLKGKEVAHLREWLRDWGSELSEKYPDFGRVYDVAFARETEEQGG